MLARGPATSSQTPPDSQVYLARLTDEQAHALAPVAPSRFSPRRRLDAWIVGPHGEMVMAMATATWCR